MYRQLRSAPQGNEVKPRYAAALALGVAAMAALSGCSAVADYNRMLAENHSGHQAAMDEYSYCTAYNSHTSDCGRLLSAVDSTVLLDPPAPSPKSK
jgi:hypothetical protein